MASFITRRSNTILSYGMWKRQNAPKNGVEKRLNVNDGWGNFCIFVALCVCLHFTLDRQLNYITLQIQIGIIVHFFMLNIFLIYFLKVFTVIRNRYVTLSHSNFLEKKNEISASKTTPHKADVFFYKYWTSVCTLLCNENQPPFNKLLTVLSFKIVN